MTMSTIREILVSPVDVLLGVPDRGIPTFEQNLLGGQFRVARRVATGGYAQTALASAYGGLRVTERPVQCDTP
jgi:hypothetical protein